MLGQLLIVAGAAIVVLILAGQLARRRLRRRYPPSGRLVDIGGVRLHLDERGTEHPAPTVVLEGGAMAPGLAWDPVQRRIAEFARVVTYDRAGLGWSDPSPRPRTAPVMADELATLLEMAGVPGPYLMVGHSVGGTVVRAFAHAHPDRVAGILLLDPSHEDQFARAPEPLRAFMAGMSRRMPLMFGALGVLVRLGFVALRPGLVPAVSPTLPPETVATIRARVASAPGVVATMGAEMRDLEASNDAVRALTIRSLGDVPLLVLSHGRPEGVPPQFGPEVAAAYERLWQELQADQARLSTRGRRVVADGVGHDVPGEAPDLVATCLREVLAEVSGTRDATGPVRRIA
jgi:pimeloyl-ACP methyl ester carboxylesterase